MIVCMIKYFTIQKKKKKIGQVVVRYQIMRLENLVAILLQMFCLFVCLF